MAILNQQVINKPLLYVNNAVVSWASNTTLTISVSQERDSSNAYDISTTSSITLNASVNGLNGLDTGSLANGTWYYVFAIGDSLNYKPHGFILSASATSPSLPFGYDATKLIGIVQTDGAAHFLKFYVVGTGSIRTHYWDAGIFTLNGGTQFAAFTPVDCSASIPPIDNTPAIFDVYFTPAVAGDSVSFRPSGSTATQVDGMSGVVAAVEQRLQMKILTKLLATVASIDYKNSVAACSTTLYVRGFEYYI